MNTSSESKETKSHKKAAALEHDRGFYHSTTVMLSPAEVFNFCKNKENLTKALKGLPPEVKAFMDHTVVTEAKSGSDHQLVWKNEKDSRVTLSATLTFSRAPADRGTIMSAEAYFEAPSSKLISKVLKMDDLAPSMLVGIFLRRLKSQLETGEIATTDGQPSGREELKLH